MRINFDIERLVPRFILRDHNGYALAKAIEAAFQYVAEAAENGLDIILDVDKMPEWRLDELAGELGCLYDYTADVETKRKWIKNAVPLFQAYGTPYGVLQFIASYFDSADLEENWEYDGDPFHFRVTVEGQWTPDKEAWARKAIEISKNVRSVLDSLRIGCKCSIGLSATCSMRAKYPYPLTGPHMLTGTRPNDAHKVIIDRTGKSAIHADAAPHMFPYPFTGTKPDTNTLGIIEKTRAGLHGEAEGQPFAYPFTGTIPQQNTLGIPGENDIQAAQAEDIIAQISYKLCGQDEF